LNFIRGLSAPPFQPFIFCNELVPLVFPLLAPSFLHSTQRHACPSSVFVQPAYLGTRVLFLCFGFPDPLQLNNCALTPFWLVCLSFPDNLPVDSDGQLPVFFSTHDLGECFFQVFQPPDPDEFLPPPPPHPQYPRHYPRSLVFPCAIPVQLFQVVLRPVLFPPSCSLS